MSFFVDRRNLDFMLDELLDLPAILSHPRHADWDRAAVAQILDLATQVAGDAFHPVAAETDRDEPRFVNGAVALPQSTHAALAAFRDAGFFGLSFPAEVGGLQAPWLVQTAASGIFTCANTAIASYPFLTVGAANLLMAFGTEAQKAIFLPRMVSGDWFGTMCLSEPQAGSSLADIRTTATPREDGSYAIKGTKMWISGGDQPVSENIVHMVLAKIPGGPVGTRGISLFVVPKRRVNADGSLGAGNNIALAGLNHKMGHRGTTNCLLNFGEGGETIGHLVGQPHRGLECMFHMMNEARIGVGYGATMSGLAGYLFSADYARTRPQGRALTQRDQSTPQVTLIEHADVRRMLLQQKAAVEGAQALCLMMAAWVDRMALTDDEAERARLSGLLALLTPVVKSWPSEHCLEANKWAIQVLGGYGYTRDYPVERFYRDNRLNHIHEGTFGIQAIDLLGRKISGDGGAGLAAFVAMMRADIAGAPATLADEASHLSSALEVLENCTRALLQAGDPERRFANATPFLDGFGHVVIGWVWLKQAALCATGDDGFNRGKRAACRYFMRQELPLGVARLRLGASLDDSALTAGPDIFPG